MTILNYTKRNIALFLTGSTTEVPTYFMIGSGSGTTTSSMTTLLYPFDRQAITAANGDTLNKVTWTGDWNSIELSGTQLVEFGMTTSGTTTTGSMWSRTGLPSIAFDGTNELRIEETWEVW